MSKRPADESKESPSLLKNTKRDDDLLAAIEAEKKRIQEAEAAKWAHVRIPFPVLTDAEFDVYVKAIENELTTYFASHVNDRKHYIHILTSSGQQSILFKAVFGEDSPVALWHAKMMSILQAEIDGEKDEMEKDFKKTKVKEWIHNCMDSFLNRLVTTWNSEHGCFVMMRHDQAAVRVYYIKN